MNENLLLNYLTKDRKRNISMLGFIGNYPICKVFKEGHTILFLGKSENLWTYISSKNKEELERVLNKFNFETKYFASLEKWMVPVISKDKSIDWELNTYRYILPEDVEIEQQKNKVKNIDLTYSNYIYEHSNYHKFTSINYLKDRINKDVAVGLFKDGKLIGWGLTHDDGALGFLHVISEYRGNGYAKEIVKKLIKKKRKINQPVFANTELQNKKAKCLLTNLGFELDREISWVKVV